VPFFCYLFLPLPEVANGYGTRQKSVIACLLGNKINT